MLTFLLEAGRPLLAGTGAFVGPAVWRAVDLAVLALLLSRRAGADSLLRPGVPVDIDGVDNEDDSDTLARALLWWLDPDEAEIDDEDKEKEENEDADADDAVSGAGRLSESVEVWAGDTGNNRVGCAAEVVGEELGTNTKVVPCWPWAVTSEVGIRAGVDGDINGWLVARKGPVVTDEALRFVP